MDRPDESLTPQEQAVQTKKCLLEIGEQIDKCLTQYKDPETIKEWRRYDLLAFPVDDEWLAVFLTRIIDFSSNLWYFVSKFTEFEPKKLFKLYKHALKKSKEKEESAHESSVRFEKSFVDIYFFFFFVLWLILNDIWLQKIANSDASPSPVKKKKHEDKIEKRHSENQKSSPSKFIKTEKYVVIVKHA